MPQAEPVTQSPTHETTIGTLTIRNEVWDSHRRELFCSVLALDKDSRVQGYIDYSVYEGEAHIKYIEVADEIRRQGVATRLYHRMVEENPGCSVKWGMTTPDGTELRKAVTGAQEI